MKGYIVACLCLAALVADQLPACAASPGRSTPVYAEPVYADYSQDFVASVIDSAGSYSGTYIIDGRVYAPEPPTLIVYLMRHRNIAWVTQDCVLHHVEDIDDKTAELVIGFYGFDLKKCKAARKALQAKGLWFTE